MLCFNWQCKNTDDVEYILYDPIVVFQYIYINGFSLAAWILHFSTLGNMFLQDLLQVLLNIHYITKNMYAQAELNFQL